MKRKKGLAARPPPSVDGTALRPERIEEHHFVRSALYAGRRSKRGRYKHLVVGDVSLSKFVLYELITSAVGPLPGAIGLAARRIFFPLLLADIGAGVVFGRNVVIRHPSRIRLGDDVMIDDYCLLDARGSGNEGIAIGEQVILNRGSVVRAKYGSITIGAHTDIGAGTGIYAQGSIEVGCRVSIGGWCRIGGGLVDLDPASDMATVTKGTIHIEDDVVLGMGATILDGVRVGRQSVVGAGVTVREDVPADSMVVSDQRLLVLPRGSTDRGGSPAESASVDGLRGRSSGHAVRHSRVQGAVIGAIERVNEHLPPELEIGTSPRTALQGADSTLDSVTLINLVVAVEESIGTDLGLSVELATERAFAEGENPFATVGSLTAFAARLLSESNLEGRQ